MTHKTTTPHPRRHKLRKGKAPKPVKAVDGATIIAKAQTTPLKVPVPDAYKLTIDLITGSLFDAKKIVVALAKENPELLIKLYRATTVTEPWQRDVVTAVYQSNPVSAIKTTRERTGLGLKEAKDIVDALRVHMSNNGYMLSVPSHITPGPIPTGLNEKVYLDLCTAANNML